MSTAMLGRVLVLPGICPVPEEGPAEHTRNALMILRTLAQMHPALWAMNPELERATRRATSALTLLDVSAHYPPTLHAAHHLHRAIDALLEVPIEWDVIPDVRAATARLLRALFALHCL
jgi:hypothetical protein